MGERSRDIDDLRDLLGDDEPLEGNMDKLTAEMIRWWVESDEENRQMAFYKRGIYGSADMVIMGAAMRVLAEGEPWTPDEKQAEQMAIGFYVLGKISRAFGAWAQGKDPSEDSWVDIEVYARMARAVEEFGKW